MPLHYSVEDWASYSQDAEKLWESHHREVAMDQDTVPLDVDWERYAALDASGTLHIVTGRDENNTLCAYALAICTTHLHYRTTLHAQYDVYYVSPPYRRGLEGYRLFQMMEKTLQARGIKKLLAGCKVSLDVGPLFERMQWRETERTFTKYIGED